VKLLLNRTGDRRPYGSAQLWPCEIGINEKSCAHMQVAV